VKAFSNDKKMFKRDLQGVQIAYIMMGAAGAFGLSLATWFFCGMLKEEIERREARKRRRAGIV